MALLFRTLLLLVLAGGALLLFAVARRPAALALDLGAPPGALTGRSLTGLGGDPAACHRALERAGIRFTALPARHEGQCGYRDAVQPAIAGPLEVAMRPAGLATSCSVAAALATWEWQVVQPAAYRRFGQGVVAIDHFGSYSCRRMYGRSSGDWSEHAGANALDVAGFRLADGRRISVARDWAGSADEAGFLHDVRDGACRLFATVLSPDYNRAHHDHLHLDQAQRGAAGWRACR